MSINLAPRELTEESSFWKKFFYWSTTIGRIVIVGTQAMVLGVFFARFFLDRQIIDLSEKIKTKQAILRATSKLEEDFRKTQGQLEVIVMLKKQQNQYSQTLDQLMQRTPQPVVLKSLDINENSLKLSAQAPSGTIFAQFITQLFTWESLSMVTLNEAHFSSRGGVEFTLSLQIEPSSYQFHLSSASAE